jgi:hypothetical protein
LIFDRVKREYLGERRGRHAAMRAFPGEWLDSEWAVSAGDGVLRLEGFAAVVQREKSIFMRDLLPVGACPCGRRV